MFETYQIRFCHKSKAKKLSLDYQELYERAATLFRLDVKPGIVRENALLELVDMLWEAEQNHVAPENLFPQGFDEFYRDLVAELPAYSAEEKKSRNRKSARALVAAVLALAIVLSGVVLTAGGYIGIWTEGIAYLAGDLNRYSYSSTTLEEVYEVTVDLRDPDAAVGLVIYEDGECKIRISSFDLSETAEDCRIFFEADGFYDRSGGVLVSGVKHMATEGRWFTYNMTADLKIGMNGMLYECEIAGMSGLNRKNGDHFGFYIFGDDHFEGKRTELTEITLYLSELTVNRWTRK